MCQPHRHRPRGVPWCANRLFRRWILALQDSKQQCTDLHDISAARGLLCLPRATTLSPTSHHITASDPFISTELYTPIPPKNELYTSVLGELLKENRGEYSGNVVMRMKFSNTTVSRSPIQENGPPPLIPNVCTDVVPSDEPSESYPHSRHSKHRKYHDPSDMERHLTFTEPSRIRYIDDDGNCVHDQYVTINYEFTTVDAAVKFQGDIRQKDMIAFFDLNLAWTNVHDLKNSYGHVTGIATVQRLKLWRDRSTFAHSITIYAKKTDGYREYNISSFHHELRRDEKKCQLHLNAPGGRRSSSDTTASKRKLSLPKLKRGLTSSSQQSTSSAASASASTSNSTSHSSANQNSDLDIRFLALEFTEREGKS